MTRFQPSLSYPEFVFTADPSYQIERLISATEGDSAASLDATLLSSDGTRISTSKLLLSLHSPFLSSLISHVPIHSCSHTYISLPDCSTASLNNLISLLISGRGATRHVGSDYRPASDVIDSGNLLGIRFGSLDYEVVEDSKTEKVKTSRNVESNKETFDESIESSNVEDTDLEARADKSVKMCEPSQRSKIDQSQIYEQRNGENNNVIYQQILQSKITNDDNEAQGENENGNNFEVEQKKGQDTIEGLYDASKQGGVSYQKIKKRQSSKNKLSLQEIKSKFKKQKSICPSKIGSLDTTKENSPYPRQCDTCGKICKNKQGMGRHMNLHLKIGDNVIYTCDTCGKLFKSKTGLHLHMKWHLIKPTGDYTCNTCGKQFKSKRGWQEHERTHVKNATICTEEESRVQNKTESSSFLKSEKNQNSNVKKRKHAALEKKSSKVISKIKKNVSSEISFGPNENQRDKTALSKQSEMCFEDKDMANRKYDSDKISMEMFSNGENNNNNNNISKKKIPKEMANILENMDVRKISYNKTKNSRSLSNKSSSIGCSDDNKFPKAKLKERIASRDCLKKQPNLSVKNPVEPDEEIFKSLENENFRRNLVTQISQSTLINSSEGDNSPVTNELNSFQNSNEKNRRLRPGRIPLSSPRKCEKELVITSPICGRSRETQGESLITDEDSLDFEWDGDDKNSSDN